MASPDDDAPSVEQHPLAARSDRRNFVNILTVVALGAIAVSVWPTETRKLEKRAGAYADALNRGDAAAAHEFLSPSSRQRVPLAAWSRARPPRREVASVEVKDGGSEAIVNWADAKTGARSSSRWVRVDRVWYEDAAN